MGQKYNDFSILICLIQIWDMEDPQNPMKAPSMSPRLITEVENIEIEESYRKLIGTASVRFPRGTVIKRTITELTPTTDLKLNASIEDTGVLITTRADSKKAELSDFRIGSRIKIMLGLTSDYKIAALSRPDKQGKSIHNDSSKLTEYKQHLKIMFDGYITQCSIDHPIEIKCENLASKLKKISCPDKTYYNATVNDLFSEDGGPSYKCNFLKNTGLKLHPQTKSCDINVGDIELNTHLTMADVLTTWAKSGLMAFVKEYNKEPYIAIGRSYFSNAGKDSIVKYQDESSIPKIRFDYHVAKNDLTLTQADLLFLAVEATALDEQGKFYHITVRRNPDWDGLSNTDKYQILNEVTISKKAQQMGATVLSKCQGNKRVDLSTYTILPYMSKKMGIKHEELLEEAIKYFESCNKNGIEGTLTLFGDLALKSGTSVELIDDRYPQKNGYYFVDEVYTTFGVSGYRQRIKLPYRISAQTNK